MICPAAQLPIRLNDPPADVPDEAVDAVVELLLAAVEASVDGVPDPGEAA